CAVSAIRAGSEGSTAHSAAYASQNATHATRGLADPVTVATGAGAGSAARRVSVALAGPAASSAATTHGSGLDHLPPMRRP
ncbi:hypothetical protein, partial [Methylobacterium sp. CG09_land_8_20_14_0_10_71_15]